MTDSQTNPLWDYSVTVYAAPGVETLLLQLQDNYGADVNLILLACWLAEQHQQLTSDDFAKLIKQTARWRAECIIPLRSVRRFLTNLDHAQELRERVKVLELDAERCQQDSVYQQLLMLEPLTVTGSQRQIAIDTIRNYMGRLPGVAWEDVMATVNELLLIVSEH